MSFIKGLAKRGVFNFSPREYKINIKKSLISKRVKVKTLKLKRENNDECVINIYGYPTC